MSVERGGLFGLAAPFHDFNQDRTRDMQMGARMTGVVPEPMAETIQAAIAAGEYASASEVVRGAMRLWHERRAFRAE